MVRPTIKTSLPPAILLGGGANSLSVARNLGRQGILVLVLGNPENIARFSRFCRWIPLPGSGDIQTQWLSWFKGDEGMNYRGAAVIPCGDDGLEFIVHHRMELQHDFLIYEANDEVLDAMLDKAKTHALAKKSGTPAPEVWIVNSREDIVRIMNTIKYPCGLKPRISHEFKKYFAEKLFVTNNAADLLAVWNRIEPYKQEMIVTELVPGGDRGYCSFYSYLDEHGQPLFHFTKRKPRQYPNGFGIGTFHITDWNPEVAELGLKFFQGVGLRGLACVEFKRDPRDGRLKLIECNHRFTEPNEMITHAGLDLPTLVYNRLTKRPLPKLDSYRKGVSLVKPWEDLLAFIKLRSRGEISWGEWLSTRLRPQSYLYFQWSDPVPFLFLLYKYWERQFQNIRSHVTKQEQRVPASTANIVKVKV